MEELKRISLAAKDKLIAFAQKIIQTPSLSGEEKECIDVIVSEMKRLRYDEAQVDGVGNAVGLVKGTRPDLPPILLNSHVDHVDPGDVTQWKHSPYAGVIEGDVLYGRGASDTKGAIAVQVYATALLKQMGLRPVHDIYVAGVVLEETGGLGTRWLIEKDKLPKFGLALLGEASANELCVGHRGRGEFYVHVQGRAAHASVPENGINPNYGLARVLLQLEKFSQNMVNHQALGPSTIAPTCIRSSSSSRNAISDWCELIIDWRYTTENPDEMVQALREIMKAANAQGDCDFTTQDVVSFTGVADRRKHLAYSYYINPDEPIVQHLSKIISAERGKPVKASPWRFCTDGGYLASVAKIPTIGFSPCEEKFAHTVADQVRISLMLESLQCYLRLLQEEYGI